MSDKKKKKTNTSEVKSMIDLIEKSDSLVYCSGELYVESENPNEEDSLIVFCSCCEEIALILGNLFEKKVYVE